MTNPWYRVEYREKWPARMAHNIPGHIVLVSDAPDAIEHFAELVARGFHGRTVEAQDEWMENVISRARCVVVTGDNEDAPNTVDFFRSENPDLMERAIVSIIVKWSER